MAVRKVEHDLERLRQVTADDRPAALAALKKALADRVNVVAAKAAKMTAQLALAELMPDLVRAFDRLMINPAKSDQQCLGKTAIVIALRELGWRESALFLRGLKHVQWEPTFGGRADSAALLRSASAVALVDCADLPRYETLCALADALGDTETHVRMDVIRSIECMQGNDAALLLRLKARLGDSEESVMGQTLESLLRVEGEAAIPLVTDFLLNAAPAVRAEAALALGASQLPVAVDALKNVLQEPLPATVQSACLRAFTLTRSPEALAFLFDVLEDKGPDLRPALVMEVLALHRDAREIRARLEELLERTGDARIRNAYQQHFLTRLR